MAIRGDKKLPFAARREVPLGYIETLTKYMEGKTYDDFANDDVLITHGVAKVMEQVGELLFPMSGHASAGLARKFYESRHERPRVFDDVLGGCMEDDGESRSTPRRSAGA